jgi:polyisoprenoid-binding protein YceI
MLLRTKVTGFVTMILVTGFAYSATQWMLQPKQSELKFIAIQAGAPFEGKFERFSADIRFDASDIARSRFEVKIDLASVNTRDGERDDTLKSADLFAVERYPTATFVAERFEHRGGSKFAATGSLTLRGITRTVPIEFTFETNATGAWLKGSGALKRLDFGVGQGEWKDTEGVANEVQVRYALLLSKS